MEAWERLTIENEFSAAQSQTVRRCSASPFGDSFVKGLARNGKSAGGRSYRQRVVPPSRPCVILTRWTLLGRSGIQQTLPLEVPAIPHDAVMIGSRLGVGRPHRVQRLGSGEAVQQGLVGSAGDGAGAAEMGKVGYATAPVGDHSGVGEVINLALGSHDAVGWTAKIQQGHGIGRPALALKLFGLLLGHDGAVGLRLQTPIAGDRAPFAADQHLGHAQRVAGDRLAPKNDVVAFAIFEFHNHGSLSGGCEGRSQLT
jgi:hypothetical protein